MQTWRFAPHVGSQMIQTAIKDQERVSTCNDVKKTAFSDFAAVSSNIGAIEVGARFAQGVTPFVILIGASGWGKSHLLESIRSYMGRQNIHVNAPVSAVNYTSMPDRCDESLPLLIDDAQDIWGNMRGRQDFRRLLERRVKGCRHTFVCLTDKVSRLEATRFLPCPQDWAFQSITVPSRKERDYIVRQIADSEGVALSRPIVTLIARHLCGDGRSIKGAIRTLKAVRADWSKRSDLFEACGVLTPYIHGEDGWDPRDLVMDVVSNRTFDCCPHEEYSRSVCAYVLISLMHLSEFDVATFLGVSPTSAYAMSIRVKESLVDGTCARSLEECKDSIVRSLDSESC